MPRKKNEIPYRAKHPYRCSEEGCKATHPQSRFDTSAAQEKGWFFQKNGKAWCPEHNPSWVAEWRLKQKENEI